MRAIFALSALALAVTTNACSFEPRDGQFKCETGGCPTGFECVAQRCVRPFDAGPPVDGGDIDSGRFDAAVLDAQTDATTPDGGPSCTADFCADFDTVMSVQQSWDVSEVVGTGVTARVEVPDAPSAPAVFESSIAAGADSVDGYNSARLSLQPPTIPEHETTTPQMVLSFDFKLTEFVDNPGVTLCAVFYGPADYVLLSINPRTTEVIELNYIFAPANTVGWLADIELDTWTNVRIAIPRRSTTAGVPVSGGITFDIDAMSITKMLPAAILTSNHRFDVGLATTNPEAHAATVQYDNVRIDYL